MVRDRRKMVIIYALLFAASLAFYLFWYVIDGVILTEDAYSYISMQQSREPGYCLYLWIFRKLLGEGLSLHGAVIGQCVVAAVAACAVTGRLSGLFSLNWFGSAGILAVQYGITLLNRFVAKRRYSYYNSIETEGLAYSLWIFFFLCILGIVYKKDRKSAAGAVLWSAALICIRKQMLITVVILFVVIFFSYARAQGWKKSGLCALLAFAVTLTGARLADCTYNLAFHGTFAPHTGDSSFILGTQLYLADREMAEYISDEKNRELFLEIMDRADTKEYNVAYTGRGWQAREEHYSSAYDRIKFDIVLVVVREDQEARGIAMDDREADYERIAKAMMRELLVPVAPRMVTLFLSNVVHGFVTTVLKVHRLLNPVALVLYLAYAVSMVWLFVHRRSYGAENSYSSLYLAVVVLLAIAVNVCLTSITIYCQMRYMLYNTGLFYQAWLVMLLEIVTGRRRGREWK